MPLLVPRLLPIVRLTAPFAARLARRIAVAGLLIFIVLPRLVAENARTATPAATRPNILFLIADDLSFHSVGFMHDPIVQTPNLDRLAKDSTVFTHAAVTTAICMVSRANMLTGQYLSVLGGARVTPRTWPNTWPALLRAAGYYGGHIGKVHVAGQTAAGYDFWAGRNGYAWLQDKATGQRVHSIQKDTDEALRFLRERPKDRPFFLQVAYTVPHAEDADPKQYLPMPQDENLYINQAVPVPETAKEEYWRRLPAFFRDPENESHRRWRWRFDTPERYQSYTKDYFRLISGMDRSIGIILSELRKQGLTGDTIVVFTGDNGYFLGEHGLADKWYAYEESVRVPLLVHDPRLPAEKRHSQCDEWVLNIDFAPTFCALAGVPAAGTMQGRDIGPLVRGETPADWRQDFLHQFKWRQENIIPASESVCSKDWKYIRWIVSGVEELFDLRQDPKETRNLSGDVAHAADLARMRERLTALRSQVGGSRIEDLTEMPFGPGPQARAPKRE